MINVHFDKLVEYISSKAKTQYNSGTLKFELKGIEGNISRFDEQKRDCGEFYRTHQMRLYIGARTFDIEGLKSMEEVFNLVIANDGMDTIIAKIDQSIASTESAKRKKDIEKTIKMIGEKTLSLARDLEGLGEIEDLDADDAAKIDALFAKYKILAKSLDASQSGEEKASISGQITENRSESRSLRIGSMLQGIVLIVRNKNRDAVIKELDSDKRVERAFKVGLDVE